MSNSINLSFAQRVASAKSVQALVRALDVFKRNLGAQQCVIELKHESGGIIVSFGTDIAQNGHEHFLEILELSEQLAVLEQEFFYAQVYHAPKEHIEDIERRALEVGRKLYPDSTITRTN